MKTAFSFVLTAIATIFSANVFAQKQLSEGVLVYNISIESTNGEKQPGGSLNGAVLTVYFTKDKSRTEMVSTPGTEATVFDTRAGKGFILKEYSGQKLMITVTTDNWSQKNQLNSNLVFDTDDGTVNIAGYACKKAKASIDDKKYTVYYDPSITVANKTYNNAFPQLKGLPVQYELQSGNLIFKYTLNKYSAESISPAKFDAPRSAFRVMTYEENQQLKKGN